MTGSDFEFDHEKYEELCALATSGTLTSKEWGELEEHLDHCAECSILFHQYETLAIRGISSLADEFNPSLRAANDRFDQPSAFARLIQTVEKTPEENVMPASLSQKVLWHGLIAASLFVGVAFVAYRSGEHHYNTSSSGIYDKIQSSIGAHAQTAGSTVSAAENREGLPRHPYIADIMDVDENGKSKKPFGRVFYTKTKSLVFYAYDLDHQPGVKQASTFQVWGRTGTDDRKAVNLGVLYMDSETNRRWILRIDNSQQLAQLDAIFVTVEPHVQSEKPTGKPFLYASLRRDANHP